MKKFVLIFSGIIILLGIGAGLMLKKDKRAVSFTAFPQAHGYLAPYPEKEEIEFEIFFNSSDSLFTEAKALREAWIGNPEKEELLPLELLEIRKTDNRFQAKGETFQGFCFSFLVPLLSEEDLELTLPEAHLFLLYRGNKEISLPVGSFAFQKIPAFGSAELYVTRLQGIVNEIGGCKTLTGICMSFRNKTAEEIIIKNIEIVSATIRGEAGKAVLLGEEEIPSGTDIRELLPSYEPFVHEAGAASIELPSHGEIRILLPVKYSELHPANRLAFRIDYLHLGEEKNYYFNEFTFFTDRRHSKERIAALLIQTDEDY